MSDLNPTATVYKSYSSEDKLALQELRTYMKEKTGGEVTLGDAIKAVTPGLETPAHLKGV